MTALAFPPDKNDLQMFIERLFCHADDASFISLRSFEQSRPGTVPIHLEAVKVGEGVSRIVSKAASASIQAAHNNPPGVFAPPVATFKTEYKAGEADMANGVAISVELDAGNPILARKLLEHILGPVTVALHSGSEWMDPETGECHAKAHFHWRLSEPTRTPEEHALLKRARWAAAVLVGGDMTAVPPCHPLRWPGSWNLKATPRIAKIFAGNPAAEVHLGDMLEKLEEAVEAAGFKLDRTPHNSGKDPQAHIAQVRAALAAIPNGGCKDWHEWNRIGMAVYRATGGSTDGLLAWSDWCARAPNASDEGCAERWSALTTSPPSRLGMGTLVYLARQNAVPEPEPIGMDDVPFVPWEVYLDGVEPSPKAKAPDKERLWYIEKAWSESDIPKRPWVVPGFLMRGSLTVVSGPGSAGKSSLMVAWGVSLALGMPFGRFSPRQKFKILSYNVEDDRDEQMRRASATARQFDASPHDFMDNLRFVGPREMGTLLHIGPDGRLLVNTPVMDELAEYIDKWQPDVVFLDPFVELHSSEENDNTAIRQVLARFRAWAVQMNIALVVLHHARKGTAAPGDPDSLRGASAIVGAARIALTVNTMTEGEAQEMGVSKDFRRDYFRLDGAKQNYSRIGDADWFERLAYTLDNEEDVAACLPWNIPKQIIGLTQVADLIRQIERGSPDGPYSPKLSSEARSVRAAMEAIGVSLRSAQKDLLSKLEADPNVKLCFFKDHKARNKRQGFRTENGPSADWID